MERKPNPWVMTDRAAHEARMNEFKDECGGMLRLYLVREDDGHMRQQVKDKNPLALLLAGVVGHILHGLVEGATDTHCIGCNCGFACGLRIPAAFVIWLPGSRHDAEFVSAMASAVCDDCADTSDGRVLELAQEEVRRVFGDMTVLEEGET
jgi:hypothetical protein